MPRETRTAHMEWSTWQQAAHSFWTRPNSRVRAFTFGGLIRGAERISTSAFSRESRVSKSLHPQVEKTSIGFLFVMTRLKVIQLQVRERPLVRQTAEGLSPLWVVSED